MDGRSQVLGGNVQRAERCVPPKVSIAHRGRDDCGKRFGRPDWAIIATVPGAVTVSLLTVGDSVNYKADGVTPYRMDGIPDGLGAFDNQDGTFTVLMNQDCRQGAFHAPSHHLQGIPP